MVEIGINGHPLSKHHGTVENGFPKKKNERKL